MVFYPVRKLPPKFHKVPQSPGKTKCSFHVTYFTSILYSLPLLLCRPFDGPSSIKSFSRCGLTCLGNFRSRCINPWNLFKMFREDILVNFIFIFNKLVPQINLQLGKDIFSPGWPWCSFVQKLGIELLVFCLIICFSKNFLFT